MPHTCLVKKHGLLIGAGVTAVALASAVIVAERLTLHPRRRTVGPSPSEWGHAFRPVEFKNSDEMTLRGWWIQGFRNTTIVMLHGYSSSRMETMERADYLIKAGYNLLLFDFRGHGKSEGDYTTLGAHEIKDALAAIDFAKITAPGPIVLFGYSLGGSVAAMTASQSDQVDALITDSAFSNLKEVISFRFRVPFLVAPLMAIANWSLDTDLTDVLPISHMKNLYKPFLSIVSELDAVVPFKQQMALFEEAKGPKTLLSFHCSHTDGYFYEPERYRQGVLSFLDSLKL